MYGFFLDNMWNNLKESVQFQLQCKVLLVVGSIPEYIISGDLALVDLTVLEEPFCCFNQFAFRHTVYKRGYSESCEHKLTSCHSKLNLMYL